MSKAKAKATPKAAPVEPVIPAEELVTPAEVDTTVEIAEATPETPIEEVTEEEVIEDETPVEPAEEVAIAEPKADVTVEQVLYTEVTEEQVFGNAHTIPWPSDPYGFTSELKAAFTKTVSRMAGDAQKKEVLDATLAVALKHMDVKFTRDNRERQERIVLDSLPKETAESV